MLTDKQVLLSGATTGTSVTVPMHGYTYLSPSVVWTTATTTGTIVFEWAHDPAFSGTWKAIATYAVGAGTPPFVDGDSFISPGSIYVRARFTVNADVAPTEISLSRSCGGLY